MDKKLSLSEPVIEGLKLLGTNLSPEQCKMFIEDTVKSMLHCPVARSDHKSVEMSQQQEYAIVTVLTEATNHDCEPLTLRKILSEHNIQQTAAVEELLRVYANHRKDLIVQLMQNDEDCPHVTNLRWRIIKDIKSSSSAADKDSVTFEIKMGRYKEDGEFEVVVEFLANHEELQSMISKFKDIARHCDKLANE